MEFLYIFNVLIVGLYNNQMLMLNEQRTTLPSSSPFKNAKNFNKLSFTYA